MNKNVRKLVKNSRKKFIRHTYMRCDTEWQDLIDLLAEFGLFVYRDPSTEAETEEGFFITNRTMTMGDFVKWYAANNNGSKWAEKAFSDVQADEELELA